MVPSGCVDTESWGKPEIYHFKQATWVIICTLTGDWEPPPISRLNLKYVTVKTLNLFSWVTSSKPHMATLQSLSLFIYTLRTTDLLVRKIKLVSNLRKLIFFSRWSFIINAFENLLKSAWWKAVLYLVSLLIGLYLTLSRNKTCYLVYLPVKDISLIIFNQLSMPGISGRWFWKVLT